MQLSSTVCWGEATHTDTDCTTTAMTPLLRSSCCDLSADGVTGQSLVPLRYHANQEPAE